MTNKRNGTRKYILTHTIQNLDDYGRCDEEIEIKVNKTVIAYPRRTAPFLHLCSPIQCVCDHPRALGLPCICSQCMLLRVTSSFTVRLCE